MSLMHRSIHGADMDLAMPQDRSAVSRLKTVAQPRCFAQDRSGQFDLDLTMPLPMPADALLTGVASERHEGTAVFQASHHNNHNHPHHKEVRYELVSMM